MYSFIVGHNVVWAWVFLTFLEWEHFSCRDFLLLFAVKPVQQMSRRRNMKMCLLMLMQPHTNSFSLPAWSLLGTHLLRLPGEEWEGWDLDKCVKWLRTELCFFFSVLLKMQSFGEVFYMGIKYIQLKFPNIVDEMRTEWLNLILVFRSLSQTWNYFKPESKFLVRLQEKERLSKCTHFSFHFWPQIWSNSTQNL